MASYQLNKNECSEKEIISVLSNLKYNPPPLKNVYY